MRPAVVTDGGKRIRESLRDRELDARIGRQCVPRPVPPRRTPPLRRASLHQTLHGTNLKPVYFASNSVDTPTTEPLAQPVRHRNATGVVPPEYASAGADTTTGLTSSPGRQARIAGFRPPSALPRKRAARRKPDGLRRHPPPVLRYPLSLVCATSRNRLQAKGLAPTCPHSLQPGRRGSAPAVSCRVTYRASRPGCSSALSRCPLRLHRPVPARFVVFVYRVIRQ